MASLNRVCLIGNLTRDPELRDAGETKVCSLGIAVNDRKDRANFFNVTCFGRTAETVAQYLAKGSPVGIDGRLSYSEWENGGQKRNKVEVIAESVQFLSSRGDSRPTSEPSGGSAPINDDIPF